MTREELKAEALINLGSEPAPKEWEKLPCIKEQMPSCIGGEVSLQRFVGTDICAWFVGIGGLWEPQSDYFRVSLPPAEGAEAKAGEWKFIGHSHQIADTGDYDGYWEITNGKVSIYTQDDDDEALQPIVDALNDSGCKFYLDDANAVENYILRHDIAELKERLAQIEQSTAEGAEEIIESIVESLGEPINIHNHIFEIRPYTVEHKTEWWIFHKEVGSGEPLAQWLQNFATLHAQRIAEKMVAERLRKELIAYDKWLYYKWVEGDVTTTEEHINEYLKSRER